MLLIICYADANRYAIDSRHVDEVVPRAALSRSPLSPDWYAGLLVHHGATLPVLDLSALVARTPCADRLNSRIILLSVELDASPCRLGVLAERVGMKEVPTERIAESDTGAGHGTLGRLLLDEEGLLQLVDTARLVSPERREVLFPRQDKEGRS